MKLSQYKALATHRLLVYGQPKSGKTVLTGMLATKFKLIWIDLERGINSVLTNLPAQYHDNIELIQIPDTKEYPMGIKTVMKILTGAKCNICWAHGANECPICKKEAPANFTEIEMNKADNDTILVIDSATQLKTSALNNITTGKDAEYKLQRDDWGNLGRILEWVYSHVQAAKFNVVVISHEMLVEQDTGVKKIMPVGGSENFSKQFAKYFDEVVYCEVKNKKHIAASSTGYALNIVTGSRSNTVIERLAEASLLPIFEGTLEAKAAASQPVAAQVTEQVAKQEVKQVPTVAQQVLQQAQTRVAQAANVAVNNVNSNQQKPMSALEKLKAQQAAKKAAGG